MAFAWGKDISYTFYPLVDDEPISIISQTPAIYVFTDSKPTYAQAAAGTGNIQAITTWTETATFSRTFTIDGIDDPEPTNEAVERVYWLAINFRIDTSEQIQTVLKALPMNRVHGHGNKVDVDHEDIKNVFHTALSYVDGPRLTRLIEDSEIQIKTILQSRGYRWAYFSRMDRLELLIRYRVVMTILLNEIQQGNDKFNIKYTEIKSVYESLYQGLKLEYETDLHGQPNEIKAQVFDTVFIDR